MTEKGTGTFFEIPRLRKHLVEAASGVAEKFSS